MGKIKARLEDVIYFYDSYDTGIPMESVLPHRPWQILFTSQMYGLIDKEKGVHLLKVYFLRSMALNLSTSPAEPKQAAVRCTNKPEHA